MADTATALRWAYHHIEQHSYPGGGVLDERLLSLLETAADLAERGEPVKLREAVAERRMLLGQVRRLAVEIGDREVPGDAA